MIKAAGQLVPLKVNAEKEGTDLAKQYKVNGYPTILFVDSKGEVFGTIGGYLPAAAFRDTMQGVIDTYKEYPAAVEALKKNANDGKANATMARVHGARGDQAKAIAALKKAEAAKYAGPDMAKAYNAVGDLFQTAEKPDEAIPYFLKGEKASKNVGDKAYSLVSIMFCYAMKGDTANAKKYATTLSKLAGAPKEYVDMANNMLKG